MTVVWREAKGHVMVHIHTTKLLSGHTQPAYWEWSQECAVPNHELWYCLLANANPCQGTMKQYRQACTSVRASVMVLFNLLV